MLKELGYKEGVVTTGSSFDHTEMDDKMMDENGEKRVMTSENHLFEGESEERVVLARRE